MYIYICMPALYFTVCWYWNGNKDYICICIEGEPTGVYQHVILVTLLLSRIPISMLI